jgi:hypothetical protein
MAAIYTNNAVATVTNGGTSAPASGHAESWTVSTTTFPSSLTGGDYFHIADPSLSTEKIRVNGITGSNPYVWSVIRGDENTTPVAHSAGFTVYEVATSSDLMQGPDDWYNVKSPIYGATGNGTTDDTAAIKAAVAAAVAAGNGGTIYFPAGTYLVSSTINCGGTYPNGGLQFRGAGWCSEITLANASNCYMFDFGASGSPVFTNGAVFADLYFNCNGNNQTTAGGAIFARGAVWCYFEHCWFETPWEAGIRFYQDGLGNFGHHNTIHACLFRDGKNSNGGPGWAVKLEQADENTLSANTFQDNCNALSEGHDAQVYDTTAGLQSIIGNHFVGGGNQALMIKSDSSPSSCLIIGNQFDGPNNANCIEVDGASASIIGNKFLFIGQGVSGGTVAGVTIGAIQGTKVIGNSFITTNSTHAVCVTEQGGSGPNIITGNEANGTFNAYFVPATGSGSLITGNIVSGVVTTVSNNTVTVTSNAGTCSVSYPINTFTNSSAATMAITIATTGAVDGQVMVVRVYDFSAAAETIGWTNTENSTASVPTTSNGSTTLPKTVTFMFNGKTSKWRCIESV